MPAYLRIRKGDATVATVPIGKPSETPRGLSYDVEIDEIIEAFETTKMRIGHIINHEFNRQAEQN